MKKILIGREAEAAILEDAYSSLQPEMIAVTGRRRVGKTYLVKSWFDGRLDFDLSGIHNASLEMQLQNFTLSLQKHSQAAVPLLQPANWLEAFNALASYLDSLKKKQKLIVFIDELPWLDTHKSRFIQGLEWFWNSWASSRNIVVIICGSAASWMINKVINNKGGLHNRVTRRLHLQPFNLTETEAFLQLNKVKLDRYHILQLYMALGGIPHYLKEVKAGESAAQNINRICFSENGLLINEFENLYSALFSNAQIHLKIVTTLGAKRSGLSRPELVIASKLSDGGTFSKVLQELEWSGFISSYYPFGKSKKDALFRLTDEFSLFYIKFMRNKKNVNWNQLSATQPWKIWSGYAFENICLKHIDKLKQALGIAAVYTEQSSFTNRKGEDTEGVQIDLLIDRQDRVVNICEMKFYDQPVAITKAFAAELNRKKIQFTKATKTNKHIAIVLVSPYGIEKPNEHSIGLIDNQVLMNDLF